jgi:hypothetical protein
MKNLFYILSILVIVALFSCDTVEENTETTIFINNQADFDKYNDSNFEPGTSILFANGETFKGQFVINGSGTKESPNLVAAYDPKTGMVFREWTDNKPIIEGEGRVNAVVLLKNGAFWEINNLEVTNNDGTKNDQGEILGIHVVAQDIGLVEDISILNCNVHNVNGEVGGKKTGGIHVNVLGDSIKTKFNNLRIENNIVAHSGGVGISNQSSWGKINTPDYHPWTNFVIRKNRVEHTGRNGIIVRYAIKAIVEYNTLASNSRFDSGHSVFNFNTVDCIVQYNEAYGNTSTNVDEIDHGGFDADYNSRGTIIQYNYSHDNNWFCGIMRKPYNTDITIRYNISQNELLGAYLYGFPWTKGVTDVKVYNNTHYFGKGKGNRVFVAAGKERIPTETAFRNNIFYFEDAAEWGFEPDSSCVFEDNLYYNISAKGENAIVGNPLFTNPGTGGTNIDMSDPERLVGYKLKVGSPAVNKGIETKNQVGKDFLGKSIVGKPDIGAFEYQTK